ncbi:MAG: hypothetical protein GOMPHAMPRED_007978 [Gomphillus americanus]|uniref:Secreted protein n=1 Tax=Gomphillus americanus TaxID=1940652 RepID=A0A8H3IHA4_9LECA|nr:MAG: hypothetical protein GOMPHAMPRED_007978 [Gomphillus americanus]
MKTSFLCIVLSCTTVLSLPLLQDGSADVISKRQEDPVTGVVDATKGLVPALSELLGGGSRRSVEKRQDPVTGVVDATKGLVPALSELLGGGA